MEVAMTAKVILNPYSNRWNAKKRWPAAEIALRAAGVDFDLAISERPGHISELTCQALQSGFSPIIAAGGDGTIGEVVNAMGHALADQDALIPLGIIPLGTANDLAYALKIPFDLTEAARVIGAGKIRPMDMGKANDIYFANNSALGLAVCRMSR
jgi:diacylglycerol kinase (ATP)